MTAFNESQDRDTGTADEIRQARFGHDPHDQSRFHRGEILDDVWEQEFDRRLAAWGMASEAESTTAVAIVAAMAAPTPMRQ